MARRRLRGDRIWWLPSVDCMHSFAATCERRHFLFDYNTYDAGAITKVAWLASQ